MIAAPSGAGKTSLVRRLLTELDGASVSISHTTRAPRPGETDGQDYYFIATAQFQQLVQAGEFLEHAQVFDYYYGTHRATVQQQLLKGIDVILEIDWQGARQVRQQFPSVQGIFILPPSLEELNRRLCERGQDASRVIQRRMQDAVAEMRHYTEFDYLIINDDFEVSFAALHAIFIANRQRRAIQTQRHPELLARLLS